MRWDHWKWWDGITEPFGQGRGHHVRILLMQRGVKAFRQGSRQQEFGLREGTSSWVSPFFPQQVRRAESRVWAGLVLAVGSDSSQTRVCSNWVVIGIQVHRLKFVACSDKQGLEYPGKKKKSYFWVWFCFL